MFKYRYEMDDFAAFIESLENAPQPTSCNLENPEDCEACGS
jgi:hypothetical protein